MFTGEIIYFASLAVLSLILLRGALTRSIKTYSYFYTQLAIAFVLGLTAYPIYSFDHKVYGAFYWIAQFATMIFACANIPEILRHAFTRDPTARRFAAFLNVALSLAIAIFISVVVVGPKNWHDARHFERLERDFRSVESLAIVTLLAAVFYFGIPLGRNLTGLLIGFGVYIGSSLLTLSVDSRFPRSLELGWAFLELTSYFISVVIYAFAFWTLHAPPDLEDTAGIARQAEELLESAGERLRLFQ